MNKKFILFCLIFFGTLHFAFSQEIKQEPINQIDELNSNISTLSQLELRTFAQKLIEPNGLFNMFGLQSTKSVKKINQKSKLLLCKWKIPLKKICTPQIKWNIKDQLYGL